MPYGGNSLVVGGFSFFGGNGFGGGGKTAILPLPPTRAVISRQ